MKTQPVSWFEIPVKDLNRAKAFYENVFNTKLDLFEFGPMRTAWFPRLDTAPGSSGGLVEQQGRSPSRDGTIVFFTVPDIDECLRTIARNGGKMVMPKSGDDEHGAIAHFEDTEGNLVALFSKK